MVERADDLEIDASGQRQDEVAGAEPRVHPTVAESRTQSGADKANQADNELPDKIDTDTDAEALRKYGLDPNELGADLGGQSPSVG